MINDDGIFLLRHPTGTAALELLNALPAAVGRLDRRRTGCRLAEQCKVRVADKRLSFPREWPYYLGWNAQASNVAGHHALLPGRRLHLAVHQRAADPGHRARRQALDVHGRLATVPPEGLPWSGWPRSAAPLHLTEKIPYQPVGGAEVRAQRVRQPRTTSAPLGFAAHPAHRLRVVLLLPEPHAPRPGDGARRLDPRRRVHAVHRGSGPGQGLARPRLPDASSPKTLSPWAPRPGLAAQPGRHRRDPRGAHPALREVHGRGRGPRHGEKYGADGTAYGNDDGLRPAPTATRPTPGPTPTKGTQVGPRQVEYVKDACNYLYETYGRFPAHVDAFYAPGMWLQFSHLEMEYYDRFFDPGQYTRQAAHDGLWHP